MSAEPVSSDPSTTLEQVEKESVEKLKTTEETVIPLQEIEKEISTGLPVPLSDSAEKTEEQGSKPPTVEEIVSSDVGKKLEADESPSLDVISPNSVEKAEYKFIEPPTPEDIIESNEVPLPKDHVPKVDNGEVSGGANDIVKGEAEIFSADAGKKLEADETASLNVVSPVEKEDKLIEPPPPPEDIPSTDIQELPKDQGEVSEGTNDSIKGETKEESVEETAVVKPEEPKIRTEIPESETTEAKEEQATELSKETEPAESVTEVPVKELLEKTEIPESAIKTSEVEEKPEPLITKEKEVGEIENVGVSTENVEKKEAALVSAPVEKNLSEEKGETRDELKKESADTEPTYKIEVDAAKDEEQKGEVTDELKKQPVEVEPINKIEVDAAKNEEILSDKVQSIELKSEVETIGVGNSEKDKTTTEEAQAEQKETEVPFSPGNVSTDVKTEVKQEHEVVNEELAVSEAKGIEEMASSAPTIQDVSKVSEAEQTSREIQLPVGTEAKKDELFAAKGTENDVEVEKKVDVEEPQKSETESKTEAASQAVEPQVVQQEGVEDNANKPDATIEKTINDGEGAKTTEETPKEEGPVKQKNSNNLLSKMKQSLVKAKKAITKKPSSKTPAT